MNKEYRAMLIWNVPWEYPTICGPVGPVQAVVRGEQRRERVLLTPTGRLVFPDSDLEWQRAWQGLCGETLGALGVLGMWRRYVTWESGTLAGLPKPLHAAARAARRAHAERYQRRYAGSWDNRARLTQQHVRAGNCVAGYFHACRLLHMSRLRYPGASPTLGLGGYRHLYIFPSARPVVAGEHVGYVEEECFAGRAVPLLRVNLWLDSRWYRTVYQEGYALIDGHFVLAVERGDSTSEVRVIALRQEDDLSVWTRAARIVEESMDGKVRRTLDWC